MTNLDRTVSKAGNCLQYAQAGCLWTVLQIVWMGLLAWGLIIGRSSWQLTTTGEVASGTVVDNREVSGEDGRTYKPVVEFSVNGQVYQIEGENSSNPPAYRVGQTVSVRYDPQDPQRARIDNLFEMWLAPGLLTCAALVMALIINVIMLVSFARGRPMPEGD